MLLTCLVNFLQKLNSKVTKLNIKNYLHKLILTILQVPYNLNYLTSFTPKPVHQKILPQQKHDYHHILADYGTDQLSKGINNNIMMSLLNI